MLSSVMIDETVMWPAARLSDTLHLMLSEKQVQQSTNKSKKDEDASKLTWEKTAF